MNQNLVANLQPSMSAMQTLIAKEQVKTQKEEKKFDRRLTHAILTTEEKEDGEKATKKLKHLKTKVSVERQKRTNTMLRLNNSVAGFLLKQSIDMRNTVLSDDSNDLKQKTKKSVRNFTKKVQTRGGSLATDNSKPILNQRFMTVQEPASPALHASKTSA